MMAVGVRPHSAVPKSSTSSTMQRSRCLSACSAFRTPLSTSMTPMRVICLRNGRASRSTSANRRKRIFSGPPPRIATAACSSSSTTACASTPVAGGTFSTSHSTKAREAGAPPRPPGSPALSPRATVVSDGETRCRRVAHCPIPAGPLLTPSEQLHRRDGLRTSAAPPARAQQQGRSGREGGPQLQKWPQTAAAFNSRRLLCQRLRLSPPAFDSQYSLGLPRRAPSCPCAPCSEHRVRPVEHGGDWG